MVQSRYVKAPTPSPELKPRYEAVLAVLEGRSTVTQAAESLGLSRLRFQTLMHRGLSGLLEALAPRSPGRPAMPEEARMLREEVASLRRENRRLEAQHQAHTRLMTLATEWMHKGLRGASRQRRPPRTRAEAPGEADEESRRTRLEGVALMRGAGVPSVLAAAAVGLSPETARRWCLRARRGQPLHDKPGPRSGPRPDRECLQRAAALVQQVRGCVGAASLGKASGLSRRTAGMVKAEVVAELERARRADAMRVEVVPGVIRGFDAVLPRAGRPALPVLVSADAGAPFRTSVVPVARYDELAVAHALDVDFALHGAPLVLRADRAKAHFAPGVAAVLRHYKVLLLNGPPHLARYYGQTERQNREHRAWFDLLEPDDLAHLAAECDAMTYAFNIVIPRRTLGWRTAADAWAARPFLQVDRDELATEVEERKLRLEAESAQRMSPGLAERIAIVAALTQRGLLTQTRGGWC